MRKGKVHAIFHCRVNVCSDICLQVYPDGLMSHCIRLWAPEDWIEMRGPFGSLPYKPNQVETINELLSLKSAKQSCLSRQKPYEWI